MSYPIFPISENAACINVGNTMDVSLSRKVHQLFTILKQNPAWKDVIPAYTSITVVYDLMEWESSSDSIFERVKAELEKAILKITDEAITSRRLVQVPVCYDLEFGIDLRKMADETELDVEEIIDFHSKEIYHVFMIGFLPGFPYMGKVHHHIACPRLSKPRAKVVAGSVGIAGEQTGIYPLDSPGGWNIVGRTPLALFKPTDNNPVSFQPGDQVKFLPISRKEFQDFDETKFALVV
jgi:inhibitor of KinA